MNEVERRLQAELSPEEYELALQLLKLPATRIRDFIEEKVREAVSK